MARLGLSRAVLVAASLCVGLGLAEGLLRLRYDALPSMAALSAEGMEWERGRGGGDCHLAAVDRIQPPVEDLVVGDPPALTVWYAGDSTTHGAGLKGHEPWWYLVDRGLSRARGVGVRGLNLSVPGASYCGARLQIAEQAAADGSPDLVMLGVHADDLVQHEVLSVGGRVVLLPSAAPARLQPLVSRSYIANIVWLRLDSRRISARGRQLSPDALPNYQASMVDLATWAAAAEVDLVAVLIPAVGTAHCPVGSAPDHACSWMREDLESMARTLDRVGIASIDLRPRFDRGDLQALAADQALVESGRADVAIHADAAANQVMAEEVLAGLRGLGLL